MRPAIKNSNLEHTQTALCFIICFLLATPFYRLIGIPAFLWMLLLLLITIAKGNFNISSIYIKLYLLVFLHILTCSYLSIIYSTIAPLKVALLNGSIVFVFLQLNLSQVKRIINYATYLLISCIFFSAIGIIYDSLGFQPIFNTQNPNGDINFFYFSTFASTKTFMIRPSAIFDEPGYLSLYISCVVIIRTFFHMDWKPSIFIMLGGLLTQSMAQFIITTIWLSGFIFTPKIFRLDGQKKYFFSLFLIIVLLTVIYSEVMDWAFARTIEWFDDPFLSPRYRSLIEIIDDFSLQIGSIISVADEGCVMRLESCTTLGGNPLVPLIFGGLLYSWPYYLSLVFLFFSSLFSKKIIISLMLFFILLGQPILLEFPYSAIFCLILTSWVVKLNYFSRETGLKKNTALA